MYYNRYLHATCALYFVVIFTAEKEKSKSIIIDRGKVKPNGIVRIRKTFRVCFNFYKSVMQID